MDHNHTLEFLINNRQDLNVFDNSGHNALWFATQSKKTGTINYLKTKGLSEYTITAPISNFKPSAATSSDSINNNNNNASTNLAKQYQDLIQNYKDLQQKCFNDNQLLAQQSQLLNQQSQLLAQQNSKIIALEAKLKSAEQLIDKHINNPISLNQTTNYDLNSTITSTSSARSLSITHIIGNEGESLANVKSEPNIVTSAVENTQANPLQVFAQLATIKPEPTTPTFAEREKNKRNADLLEAGRNKFSRG